MSSLNSIGLKSRRDNTLLTVDFNLRTGTAMNALKVPQGRYFVPVLYVVPAGLCRARILLNFRRLKPTVNRVSSLRDSSPLTRHLYELFIFHPIKKKSIVIFALITFPTLSFAQSYRPATPEQQKELTQKIAAASEQMKTLRCDFVQKSTISILADEMVSEGALFFKQSDKLSWEYTKPFQYRFTLNGDKVMIHSGETRNIIDVNQSKLFKDISKIIISGINGTGIFEEDRFAAKINIGTQDFQVVLTPKPRELRQLFKTITLTFNKTDYTVNTVEIREQSDDITLIIMTNKQINKELDDEIFAIR